MTSRRGFLLGLGAALAAPSIVRAESLMKLWVPPAPKIIRGIVVGPNVWRFQPPAIERAVLLGWTHEQILSNAPVPFLPPAMIELYNAYIPSNA